MKLSDLFKQLFAASEFTSPNSLATYTGQTHPFVAGLLSEERKDSMEKMDVVFDALTPDVTADELIAALELIKIVRRQQIQREQFIWPHR